MSLRTRPWLLSVLLCSSLPAQGAEDLAARVDAAIAKVQPRIIEWRRDFHQNPELSNREFRTSKIVAEHLRKLGLQVDTGIAKTAVVGVLKGGRPGPTIALRADMDGLPVVEQTDLPFRSKVTSTYRNETVGDPDGSCRGARVGEERIAGHGGVLLPARGGRCACR